MTKSIIGALLIMMALGAPSFAAEGGRDPNVVIQSNVDQAEFKRALTLASNMHEVMPKGRIEVVVFGTNVQLLTAFSDAVPLIQKVQTEGIRVIACGRSLTAAQLQSDDLAPGVDVVPFGAVHVVERQRQGWQYIKP